MAERETGKVKWFNDAKGYGFIERPEGGDLFVHFSSVRGTGFKKLTEGQSVDYVVAQGEKGPQAQDVGPAAAEIPQRLRDLEAQQSVATAVAAQPATLVEAEAEEEEEEEEEEQKEEEPTAMTAETSADDGQADEDAPFVAEASGDADAEGVRPVMSDEDEGSSGDAAETDDEAVTAVEARSGSEAEEETGASP
jgi:CspA family cold shock protein